MKYLKSKKTSNTTEIRDIYILINDLIKEKKIKFRFYNDKNNNLEIINYYLSKKDNTIELEFRNKQKENIEELKKILKEKQ